MFGGQLAIFLVFALASPWSVLAGSQDHGLNALKPHPHPRLHHQQQLSSPEGPNTTIQSNAAGRQPSPSQDDLVQYVNMFVGTAQNRYPGNVFAGSSVPFGMAKVTINVEGYAPAGYASDTNQPTRGVSPLHDSGTGSSAGSYGNFCVMPVLCDHDDIQLCPTLLDPRLRHRLNGTDKGHPGVFSTTLDNHIKIQVTSTRRATLERYTFPAKALANQTSSPHLVLDWTNDSPGSFRGGFIQSDWEKGRLIMNGTWLSSFGPSFFNYKAFQCVDLLYQGKQQLGRKALFGGDRFGMDTKREDISNWTRDQQVIGQPTQAGAVVAFKEAPSNKDGSKSVLIRRGVSFKSAEKACENMEQEIPYWDFDKVSADSHAQWQDKLKRIQLDPKTNDTIKRLFYTSFYRTFLSPNNATGDGPFDTSSPYFDGLYCSWDTFRTFFPLLSLSSPRDLAQIVETYIDGYRKEGWLPECRANQVKGFTQGGNNAVPILADFAVKYHNHANELGINLEDLYKAMTHDLDFPSPNYEYEGRQAEPFQKYGYLPLGYLDPVSTGEQSRTTSRGLEYSFGDFTASMTAEALSKKDDVERYKASSLNYSLNFDPKVKNDGFSTFAQQRFVNGTFKYTDPTFCSPQDNHTDHACSLQQENIWGVYESSSWEYSFYAPHDVEGLVQLLGGAETFDKRLDHLFAAGYFSPTNEPSFQCPILYHYIGKPYKSVRRVRQVIFDNFSLKNDGLPGNDDNGAMASLLVFHLMGLYPVPGSKELILLSPLMPSYTIHNELFGDVTVKVTNFDEKSVAGVIQEGVRAFIKQVKINGRIHSSVCRIGFEDLFPASSGAKPASPTVIEIEVIDKDIEGCGPNGSGLPASLSTGGFLSK